MKLLRRFRALFRRKSLDAEMAEEMRHHLDAQVRRNLAAGMSPEEAHYAARRSFGGVEQIKERARDRRGFVWWDHLTQDLRYAVRSLRKAPGFAAVVVATLALGIGANTGLFTVLYGIVWRPLPVRDPAAVVNVHQEFDGPSFRHAIGGLNRLSYPEYLNYRDRVGSLAGFAAFEPGSFTVGEAETGRVPGVLATGNYFSVLGAATELGRTWSPAECEVPGDCPLAVLSYGFWQQRFGGDREVVGRTIMVNRQPLTVIGVAARDFHGAELLVPAIWIPLKMRDRLMPTEPGRLAARDFSWLITVGRLATGASLDQARGEFRLAAQRSDADSSITAHPGRKTRVLVKPGSYFNSPEDIGRGLPVVAVVMTAVGLTLVVVCANVSNLLLARASVRRREIGVRLALGASRGRLVRQLLTESLLLSFLAGALGLVLAVALPPLFFAWGPAQPLPLDLTPNLPILGYCTAVSLFAGICFGLAPALQATRLDLSSVLASQGAHLGGRIGGARLRDVLVIAQVAVSFLLLIGAGLLVRGLQRAMSTDLGFERKNLFVLSADTRAGGYDDARALAYSRILAERIGALSGVQALGFAFLPPFAGTSTTMVKLAGEGASAPTKDLVANSNTVSPGYFEALGIVMVRGRPFSAAEVQSGLRPAVISQAMASRFWPGEDPIGRRFFTGSTQPHEVIGIARDISSLIPGVTDGPYFYLPPTPGKEADLALVVRADAGHPVSARTLRELALAPDPNLAVSVRTLDENMDRIVAPARLASLLAGAMGLLALALVAVGVYGVMAYVVSQRTREIGVRLALGAEPGWIHRQMIGEGVRVVAIGIGIGCLLAFAGTRVLQRAIFGLSPLDPVTFAGVATLLAAIAVVACWLPARRAARVDPMVALRCE